MTATKTTPRTWVAGEVVTAALLNTYLRDNMDWLFGRPYARTADYDGTVYSTTSSTFQDTGLSAVLTTTGGRVLVVAWGSVTIANASTAAVLSLYQDGSNMGDSAEGMQYFAGTTSARVPFCIVHLTPAAPTAAEHTWKLYLRSTDNTNAATIKQIQFWAMEIGA